MRAHLIATVSNLRTLAQALSVSQLSSEAVSGDKSVGRKVGVNEFWGVTYSTLPYPTYHILPYLTLMIKNIPGKLS